MGTTAPHHSPRRWLALVVISIAQLMVTLDSTIVNVALPRAQADLGFSDANRQWVITAYSLAFGGLLLVGGRLSDMFGRKRVFVIGLVGFGLASALGGFAPGIGTVLAARALQGAFAAILAPAALSLLSLAFHEPRERATAFGVFSGISGAGGAIGLLLGGFLTELVSWRWTLLVNLFFALAAVIGALVFLHIPEPSKLRQRLDMPGVILGTVGLAFLVYSFSVAQQHGWTAPATIGAFGLAVVLLVLFVVRESRTASPLLPLRVVTDRLRGGSYLTIALTTMGLFAPFLLLTFYLQRVLHFSPIQTGLAFLPLTLSAVVGATQIGTRLTHVLSARTHVVASLLVAASGAVILAQIHVDTSYWAIVLPGFVLLGVGLGSGNVRLISIGTKADQAEDAGIASAMISTSQQVGAAIGTAALSTIAVRTATALHATGTTATAAAVHGYSISLYLATGLFILGAAIAAVTFRLPHATQP